MLSTCLEGFIIWLCSQTQTERNAPQANVSTDSPSLIEIRNQARLQQPVCSSCGYEWGRGEGHVKGTSKPNRAFVTSYPTHLYTTLPGTLK